MRMHFYIMIERAGPFEKHYFISKTKGLVYFEQGGIGLGRYTLI